MLISNTFILHLLLLIVKLLTWSRVRRLGLCGVKKDYIMDKTFEQSIKNREKINPELTIKFVEDILERGKKGIYRVGVKIIEKIIPIDIYPNVFPPKSDYSISSRSLFESIGNLNGMEVADIGSGSGIESIVAVLSGATHVDATDISQNAVLCSSHNVEINGFGNKISVYQGDLFSSLPDKKYNLIIANLPIVDYKPQKESDVTGALYDPDFVIHKRLFMEAKNYLKDGGIITFSHSNLQSKNTVKPYEDFEILENLIREYCYEILEKTESQALGYKWINYRVKFVG